MQRERQSTNVVDGPHARAIDERDDLAYPKSSRSRKDDYGCVVMTTEPDGGGGGGAG
ncbi:MAG TPA: hypothetical protein VK726_07295 [Acetobacteraceae bacterium]|jgi:hypothetical protein|nr:hypothetical protein [Acetobacteraceae bacterium]